MNWFPFSWSNKPRADVADGSQTVFTRLTTRFRLTDDIPPALVPSQLMRVSKTILPITNMDELLRQSKFANTTGVDISGATPVVAFTVPSGKRWHLMAFDEEGTTAATKVGLYDGTVDFALEVSATARRTVYLSIDSWLEPGMIIRRDGTSNAGDTNRKLSIWYHEEDAF